VHPSLEHDHGPSTDTAQQQPAVMPRCGRRRPAGQRLERDGDHVLEIVGQPAEARAQHDADLGNEIGSLANGRDEGGQTGGLRRRRDGPGRVDGGAHVRHAGLQA
jgi:hypothetical protein